MTTLTAGIVARAYLIVMLFLPLLVASPFQLGLAVGLLVVQLYSVYKRPKAGLDLALTLASLVLAPLALEALVGAYAGLLVIPALFLVDTNLKEYAMGRKVSFVCGGRVASDVLKSLLIGLLLVLALSVVVWNLTLVLSSAVLLAFVVGLVGYVVQKVPKSSLVESKSWSRTVVGDSEDRKVYVKSKASAPVLVKVEPVDKWVGVKPSGFVLPVGGDAELSVGFVPPLAGPSKVTFKAVFVDVWGLVLAGQILEPFELHIIPRAKYAKWLASRYLEQTASGAGSMTVSEHSSSTVSKGGVEFQGSRPYQIGDKLKDIDWRHSYMLGELIVKEYSGAQGNVGVLVADLSVENLEEADVLAYNLVISALTLAIEGVPSALAIYDNRGVVLASGLLSPREVLKKALELTAKIGVVESKLKVLEPAELSRVKRNLSLLSLMKSEEARGLSRVLRFESEALDAAAETESGVFGVVRG